MDDILFECTYTDSEDLLREAFGKVRDKGKVDLGCALIIFSVPVLALAIWMCQFSWVMIAAVLFGVGVYCLNVPKLKARSCMDHIRRINNGTVPSARIVVDDKITHYYKSDTAVILLVHLRFAYFLKQTIVLVGEEGTTIFERSGFTKGTPEEFEVFLREKCPQIQIVHKV